MTTAIDLAYMPVQQDQAATDIIRNDQVYVTGYVVEDQKGTGVPIPGVSIQIFAKDTGLPLSDAFTLGNDGYYEAWTDQQDNSIVVFKAEGFKERRIPFPELVYSPDVIMTKEGGIPGWAFIAVAAAVLVYRKQSGKVGAMTTSDVTPILFIIGGLLAANVVIKILKKLNLWGDPTAGEQSNPNSAFKPTYWQGFTTYTYAITESQAREYSKTIHNAFTVFQDDYNAIKGVFGLMRTKANVSFLAWVFQKEYNEDLLSFLTDGGGLLPWDGLSTEHLETILAMVSKLPTN